MSNKRKMLSLQDRIEVLDRHDKGDSARIIALAMGCGKTQIQSIIKDKLAIRELWQNGIGRAESCYVKPRKCTYEDLNEQVFKWVCEKHSPMFPLSGKFIQERAREIAEDMGYEDFSASNGWLDRFRTRYNIAFGTLSGESGDVNESVVEDWSSRLPDITKDYELCDIFNVDETGLYYRAMPTRSMTVPGEKKSGTKISKERITVMAACSATGEKLPLLVIGKSENPRCFRGYEKASLGVRWEANKKAWMTTDIFRKWLTHLNNSMSRAGRHILLLLDNCPAHPDLQFSNIKLVFLPKNTTSRLQPLDAGIIQNIKLQYRKRMMRHLLHVMDQCNSVSELVKRVTVLDAIGWLRAAWESVQTTTIEQCFAKCGFKIQSAVQSIEENDDDDMDYNPILGESTISSYVEIDADIEVHAPIIDTNTVEEVIEVEDDDEQDITPPPSMSEASMCLQRVRDLALQIKDQTLLEAITRSQELLLRAKVKKSSKGAQSTMDRFLC